MRLSGSAETFFPCFVHTAMTTSFISSGINRANGLSQYRHLVLKSSAR